MPVDSIDSVEATHREKIEAVYGAAGCGRTEARQALEKRAWHVPCAVEYVQRTGLAAVMSDATRYPLWTKLQADDAAAVAKRAEARPLHSALDAVMALGAPVSTPAPAPEAPEAAHPLASDADFLSYVSIHSETDRALFHVEHIYRLFMLACAPLPALGFHGQWYSMHSDVAHPLVSMARRNLGSLTFRALAPLMLQLVSEWRADRRVPGGFNEYAQAVSLARRGNMVSVSPDLLERLRVASRLEPTHCRTTNNRYGLCLLHDCGCPCTGCNPKDELVAAKIALADAVLAELTLLSTIEAKVTG